MDGKLKRNMFLKDLEESSVHFTSLEVTITFQEGEINISKAIGKIDF
jgi:hypothetical protein